MAERTNRNPGITETQSARGLTMAMTAARAAGEQRGRDVVVLDMREVTPIFDYFVLATGSSRRQLHAMSEEIDHALEDDLGDHRQGIEGYDGNQWILLDYGNVMIHLFDEETRKYYALEELWGGAARVAVPEVDCGPTGLPGTLIGGAVSPEAVAPEAGGTGAAETGPAESGASTPAE